MKPICRNGYPPGTPMRRLGRQQKGPFTGVSRVPASARASSVSYPRIVVKFRNKQMPVCNARSRPAVEIVTEALTDAIELSRRATGRGHDAPVPRHEQLG